MSEENDFTVTVDGTEHKFSDLSDENKLLVSHIRDLDAQVDQLNFRFEQLNASKSFFSDKLVASLSTKASEASAESVQEAPAESVQEEAPQA